MIDHTARFQVGLKLQDLYPSLNGLCACGCGQQLTGRKTRWASQEHIRIPLINFLIVKGDTAVIRRELYKRDFGMCRSCGLVDPNWEADHILPVFKGGGACGLDNFQTLCVKCHKIKTNSDLNP